MAAGIASLYSARADGFRPDLRRAGISWNRTRRKTKHGQRGVISAEISRSAVRVIHTDEECMIEPAPREEPQHTRCILGAPSRGPIPGPGFPTSRCTTAVSSSESRRAS